MEIGVKTDVGRLEIIIKMLYISRKGIVLYLL